MGCCIGNLSKSQPLPDYKPKTSVRKKPRHLSIGKRRQCSSGLEAMENNVSVSVSLEGNISSLPNSIINDSNGKDTSFINHAAIAWAEMRRQWTGDQEKVPKEASQEPIIRFGFIFHLFAVCSHVTCISGYGKFFHKLGCSFPVVSSSYSGMVCNYPCKQARNFITIFFAKAVNKDCSCLTKYSLPRL
jgi:hypothetical protein